MTTEARINEERAAMARHAATIRRLINSPAIDDLASGEHATISAAMREWEDAASRLDALTPIAERPGFMLTPR